MRWALCLTRTCSDSWHIQLLVRANECNCFLSLCANWSRKNLCFGPTCWFVHNLGVRTIVYRAAGNIQAAPESERQEISRSLLNPLCLHAAYTGSPIVQTHGLHACPLHTCVNHSRDMFWLLCYHNKAVHGAPLCQDFTLFVQYLLYWPHLVFFLGGSSASPHIGHLATSLVHQYR